MAQITLNSSGVASDGALALQSNGTTTAVTISTAQNVGIGTASPARLLSLSAASPILRMTETGANSDLDFIVSTNSGGLNISVDANNEGANSFCAVSVDGSERARIDSSGNLLVGTTSSSFGEKLSVQSIASNTNIAYFNYTYTDDRSNTVIKHARATGATAGSMILFVNASGSQVGLISSTGSVTTYSTSSDYRLKENIAPITGALAKVAQLKPCTYTWKDGGEQAEGFIAHELQEVVPHAVVGDKDAVNEDGSIKPQSIDTSFLVATLTAAIQEQQALITTLTDRITALEAK